MFLWYVINTYSGHENKVKANLEHRIVSLGQQPRFRRVVVPTEQVIETKDGQKVQIEKRVLPGYVLVNMDLNDDAWTVVKNTPVKKGLVSSVETANAVCRTIPRSNPASSVATIVASGSGIKGKSVAGSPRISNTASSHRISACVPPSSTRNCTVVADRLLTISANNRAGSVSAPPFFTLAGTIV